MYLFIALIKKKKFYYYSLFTTTSVNSSSVRTSYLECLIVRVLSLRSSVINGFYDRALILPSYPVFTWACGFEHARAARSLVCVPCFMLERGVRILAFMSWVSVSCRDSDTRAPRSVSLCECAVSSSCFVVLHAVFIGCMHSCYVMLCQNILFHHSSWWNDLSTPIRNAGSLSIFKQQLKTHLCRHKKKKKKKISPSLASSYLFEQCLRLKCYEHFLYLFASSRWIALCIPQLQVALYKSICKMTKCKCKCIQQFWATVQSVFLTAWWEMFCCSETHNNHRMRREVVLLFISRLYIFKLLNMLVIILVNILYFSFISLVENHRTKARSTSIAFVIDLLGIPDLSDNGRFF